MIEKQKVQDAINHNLADLKVTDEIKNKVLQECGRKKQIRQYHGLKIASCLFVLLIALIGISDGEVQAAIKRMLVYLPISEKVVSLDREIYQIQEAIIVNLEEGYIKVAGCQIENGNVEIKIYSNIGKRFGEWCTDLKIIDENGRSYTLEVNGGGMGSRGKYTWQVEAWGEVELGMNKFEIVTPYGNIPVVCTAAKELKSLDELGVVAYDKEIYVTARKEPSGEETMIILNAFDQDSQQLEAEFMIEAYDTDGIEIPYNHGDERGYYFNVPSDKIAGVRVTRCDFPRLEKYFDEEGLQKACKEANMDVEEVLNKGIYSMMLNEFWKTESKTLEIKVPGEEKIVYNKEIQIGEYKLKVLEGYRVGDELAIEIGRPNPMRNEGIGYIQYSFDKSGLYEYRVEGIADKDIIYLQSKQGFPEYIKLDIEQFYVDISGNWDIQFE